MIYNLLSVLFFFMAGLCGYLYCFGQPAEHLVAGEFLVIQNLIVVLGLASFGAGLALLRYKP